MDLKKEKISEIITNGITIEDYLKDFTKFSKTNYQKKTKCKENEEQEEPQKVKKIKNKVVIETKKVVNVPEDVALDEPVVVAEPVVVESVDQMLANTRPAGDINAVKIDVVPDFSNLMQTMKEKGQI